MKGIHPIKAIKSVLPSKLSASQRYKLKMTKAKQSLGKSAINEAGKTIRHLSTQVTTAGTLQKKIDMDALRRSNDQAIDSTVEIYNKLVKGGSDNDESTINQDKATTQVGGGSSINDGR